MEKPVSVAEAKNRFSDLLNRVIYRGERIVVSKHGKPVGALVSTEDLNRLEELDKLESLERMNQVKKRTKKYLTLQQAKRAYEKNGV